jgi:pilus assembly protein Flp/PilA
MKSVFVRFVREEAGQDLIEYAMIATLVALVVGVGATALGTNLNTWYGNMATAVSTWAGKAS